MIRTLILTATVLGGTAAQAATIYTVEADYLAALGGTAQQTQGFAGVPDGLLGPSTTFSSGVTVSYADVNPSTANEQNDINVQDETLRLSIDNSGDPDRVPNPRVEETDIGLPVSSSAFSFLFGAPNDSNTAFGRGVGNDSGTSLSAGGFTFDFTTGGGSGFTLAQGNAFSSGGTGGVGYTGFFGAVADPGERFRTITFSSNGLGTDTDDDFTVRAIAFAPVPVPAALPLLALGLGGLAALRRRRG